MDTNAFPKLKDTTTVAEIALNFPEGLDVLNRYHLDFCCGGDEPFVDACADVGLDAQAIWEELKQAQEAHQLGFNLRFTEWNVPALINFIVENHHRYVNASIPRIGQLLDKVCSTHGGQSPFLFDVRDMFTKLGAELSIHMTREEQTLFPGIQGIFSHMKEDYYDGNGELDYTELTRAAEGEHERAGNMIKYIRNLTDQYQAPDYACPTFKAMYLQLKEFDKDLMQHIHLENNILFQKAKSTVKNA